MYDDILTWHIVCKMKSLNIFLLSLSMTKSPPGMMEPCLPEKSKPRSSSAMASGLSKGRLPVFTMFSK